MRRLCLLAGLVVISLAPAVLRGADAAVIFDMDSIVHSPGEFTDARQVRQKAGVATQVEGKFAKAVKFSFVEGASGGFFTAPVLPTAEWDKAAGLSFWVKGDGTHCFPTDSTEWKKITVRWSDLVPELKGPLVDPKKGFAPSHFGNFWFGKWFYYRDYPAVSFTIDQVMLETSIPAAPSVEPSQGLTRFKAKLAAKQPVTIVTMGDSLSDKRHWANRDIVWSDLLAKSIKDKFGSEVKIVNPAIGGTTLSQNIILIPRWIREAPSPDLVIVWFGGNDWDTGVRGPLFADYLRLGVDRIREQTGGSADVLLLTTSITFDRWDGSRELEEAVTMVAGEKKTGLVDIASIFRKTGSRDEALKRTIWAWDKVHLGKAGHQATADAIMNAF